MYATVFSACTYLYLGDECAAKNSYSIKIYAVNCKFVTGSHFITDFISPFQTYLVITSFNPHHNAV